MHLLDPLKFLGYELGSQTTYKKDKGEDICIINGEFTSEEVQNKLDQFIVKYVCCAKCNLPELVMKIIDGKIRGDCKSCGNNALLDNKHKMAAYITKNPPTKKGQAVDGKVETGKKKGGATKTDKEGVEGVKKKSEKKKKERVFSDPAFREFRAKLVEADYPLDSKAPVVQELLKLFETSYASTKAEEGISHWKVVEKSYRNLKTLKISRDKQMLYGYVFFNTIFTKNIAAQITKEKELPTLIVDFYKVSFLNIREATERLSLATR